MNIRKFMTYVPPATCPEVVPYLAFGLSSAPLALTVPQILAVDLGTDMVPGAGPRGGTSMNNVMDEPPRPRTERLLNREMLVRAYGFLGLILKPPWPWGLLSVPAPPGMGVGKSARLEHAVVPRRPPP